ncbi:hypothetical protein SAMN06265365_102441 [Tistlia consotensis]|uniref:Uncharacterized protein n=1 Tax=Tistlia consotensis USBA 355 TaxID=560819 RepID=A0A1Y6C2B1_9PROT|nr:hypothetical protein [Tistlia consotensis]SMF38388.1 hypothetical protein SAMN05428998_11322 [Tistlia consotensis USBA 355]SNR37192.1 hypothetical protein SAMN06265365_102441 [Tistlia consotensis]
MATFKAHMLAADTGGEGVYAFDAPDGLLQQTPARVVRHFMERVDRSLLPHEHVDYELNAALKNAEKGVVTAMGSLILERQPPIPFLLMISAH